MELGTEERRLAIEIIATLVHIKRTMAELILKPAGVPPDVYQSLLYKQDEVTGRHLSKRQIAPFIIEAVEKRSDCAGVIRRMIEIASNWSSFHLANDEFAARATVQKARETTGTIELMEAREAQQRELARKEELARMEKEKAELFKRQSELLLMMLDELAQSEDSQRKGFLLEELLNRTFDLHQIPVVGSFRRNKGAEQIDGAFRLEGWHYLIECKWVKGGVGPDQLDSFLGKIHRSGKQSMGLFLSIEGWSKNVCPLLKQNPEKSIILMDGYDLRCVLDGQINLRDFLLAKLSYLNEYTEPHYSAKQYLKEINTS